MLKIAITQRKNFRQHPQVCPEIFHMFLSHCCSKFLQSLLDITVGTSCHL